MKGLVKSILFVFLAAVPFLIFVHTRISTVHVSYEIEEVRKELAVKSEMFRRLKYEVEKMKALPALEKRMRELSLNLSLPTNVELVRIPRAASLPASRFDATVPAPNLPGRMLQFLGRWVGVAQAKE